MQKTRKDKAMSVPDELTEEMKVQKMNEKNRSIYDIERSETAGGATSILHRESCDEDNKNKINRSSSHSVRPDKKIPREIVESRLVEENISGNKGNNSSSTIGHSDKHSRNGTSVNTGAKPKTSLVKLPGEFL